VTPLHDAAKRGFTDTCETLVRLGADVNADDDVSEMRYSAIIITRFFQSIDHTEEMNVNKELLMISILIFNE
jgi:hypothetical protein